MIGIYKITSPSSRVYIGQSIDIEHRWNHYYIPERCHKQPKLIRSLKKYGALSHVFEVLEECNQSDLNSRERYYQELYNCTGEMGLNGALVSCNDKSGVMPPDVRLKISEAKKGKQSGFKGKITAQESIEKRRQSKAINRHNIVKIILDTETGIFYYGAQEAADAFNINRVTITSYLLRTRKKKRNLIYV